jgi:hypothetical protein
VAQLCRYEEELERLNTEVLLISFGDKPDARDWLKETCPSFRLLLDPQRTTYHRYGLEHSWRRSGGLKTLRRYVQLIRGGRRLHGIKGDPAQLGGDFIVGSDGLIQLAHPSHDPTDRPPASELVAWLGKPGKSLS